MSDETPLPAFEGRAEGLGRWSRAARAVSCLALIALVFLQAALPASANITGTWTPSAAGGSASANGTTVTLSLSPVGAPAPSADTMNGTNFWSSPYSGGAVNGGPSLFFIVPPTGATATISFSKPVDNPVIHMDRLGGVASGIANSSSWTLTSAVATSAVTLARISGNTQFVVSGSNFVRTTGVTAAGGECASGSATGTACGSIQFNGTNITSLTFSVVMQGAPGLGDGVEISVSLPETNVIVRKQTVDVSPGAFTFAGTNGVGSPTLDTSTTNPISSTSYSVTDHTQPITIAETVPAGYRIDSTTCVNEASGAVTSTFTGSVTGTGTINIAAAAYDGGGQTITCTVVNKSRSDMSVSLAGLGPATLNVPYSGTYSCTNAASPFLAATAATCAITGLPAGLTSSCTPTPPTTVNPGAAITCTVSGTPTTAGTVTLTGTTGATNDLNLPNNTATASFSVNGSDMSPDLSGLPATATVGVPYAGTVLCTNSASATGAAINASCNITGLPPGVTVGTCTPTPPATVAIGASISCPVSGTPTATGTTTVTATTGATNDTNGGTGTGGNNTATATVATNASDMSINLSGLPTSGNLGVPYSGTYTCANASAPAVAASSASCAIAGLPAGLTSLCSPTPPATVAPGATITCTVSGTPTATGSSTLNGTTGATNDGNAANNNATTTLAINGSDMVPDLSGLPTTATVGVPYSGTVLCTNSGSATAAAVAASCNVSGLPAGVTVGTCTPTPPASVAIGASISCTVSGTPTATGSVTVTATTGATNDTNGGTGTGGNNSASTTVATNASDMSIDLSGLPGTANLGVPYSGTYTCSNAASPAVTASSAACSITGLPAGLTSSCTPTPPATIAPGGTISCTVSGTPTATGSSTLNGTTGATNDGTAANNTATASLNVVGSDMSPSIAGLPTTATVGVPYSGTVTCSNAGPASAISATCAVSGLPPGVTLGTCTPTPPATIASGSSISCSVSGTPTAPGSVTVTATSGATNDTNGGTGTGGNNSTTTTVATTASDMSINLAGLPASGGVGQPYSGTYTCTNASAPAIAATSAACAISGLPAGLSANCTPAPPATVAPGATISCSVTGTPTAAGSFTANGTTGATNDGNAANNTATAPINIGTPQLSIAKSSTTTTFSAVGVVIPYSFVVTNSGSVRIFSPITVSDSRIASVSCPAVPVGGLASAASITCTGSYTTTQADLDAGGVTNTASATSGTTTSPTTNHTVPATQTPGLSVVKTPSPLTYATVGQTIGYSYVVRNTGNVTITSPITVADDKIASVSCPALPAGGLAPNATLTCSGSAVVTQADIDTGSIVNTASATDGTTTSPTVTATVNAVQSRALSIVKDSTTTSFSATGVSVPYTFAVTNAGNTTLTAAVTVSDSRIAPVSCPALPAGGLAPGASITCTGSYTTSQADLDSGSVVNTASASSGPTTSPTSTHTLPANQSRSLSITKTPSPATYSAVGQTISYSFVVRNTGNITIPAGSPISVADDKIASVTCPAMPAGGLAPNATLTCTASATVTQANLDAGSITNIASATDGIVTSPATSATVSAVQSPVLTIVKSSTSTTYATVGQTIPYSFEVTNSGNITLTSVVTVSDSRIASVSCPALPVGGLAPGASITCSGSYAVTQADLNSGSIVNTASASSGTTTSPSTTHTITGTQTRSLGIVKSSTTASFSSAGVSIPYSFAVTNTGNVTLTSAILVSDNRIASVVCPALPAGGLAPLASISCTGSYTTTQADVDAGGVTNTASASSGATTSPTTNLTVPAVRTPSLTIAKSSTTSSYNTVGQVIPLSFQVTNSGNVTLTSAVTVSDNSVASVTCPALPAGGLIPGAFITCAGSYTITQADLDAGSHTNTASASSGATSSLPTNLTIPANQAPGLTIVKSTTTTVYAAAGVVIPYSYRVTNSGNVTLTSAITVSDNKIASVSCPALPGGVLAPGAFITCSGTYTTTQADVNAGALTNTASASSGSTVSPTVSVTVPAAQTPALSIVKSTTLTTYNNPGDVVPYSFVVTNAGNVTLTNAITVSDSKIGSVSCPALPAGGLLPGNAITCTGSYTIVQNDIDGGNVLNTASARSGLITSPTVTYTLTGTQTPRLTIAKSSTTTAITSVGQLVPYAYTLTNTGNVTLTVNATVTDSKIASVSCPAMPVGGLAPTQSISCTASYTVTQADLDAGSVVNTASATSGTPTVPVVSNTTAVTIPVTQSPALSLGKSTTSATYTAVGAVVPYTFTVTNSGNVTITSPITVSDDKIASVTCPALPAGGLVPGASIACSGSYTITQADLDTGSVVNTATTRSGTTVSSPPTIHTLPGTQSPALSITKTASPTGYNAAGAVIGYTYVVRNTGNVTLPSAQAITVSDNKIASVSCPALPPAGLAPGASITCTANYTINQTDVDAGTVVNTATATNGSVTSPVATATVTATQTPAIAISKSTTTVNFSAPGVVVPYSFVVRNSGNVTITTPISITDNKVATVSCPPLPAGGLAPSATITCTGSYTTTQADVNAGSVVNTASASSGPLTSSPTSHTLPAVQTRSLSLTKTPSPATYATAGVAITYTYVVRNTGNVTIPAATTISVADNKIASVSCPAVPAGGLAPNATLTCTATATTTQADVDAGSITNIASATDGTAVSANVSATVTANQAPSLALVKSTTATGFSAVGTVIPYSFRVTNNGNITLTQAITVSDSKIASVACPALPAGGLVPGGIITCTGNYTITQADIDTGNVVNTATARSGTLVSTPPTTHTLTGTQSPALTIVKSTTTANFSAPGVVIPYSYRVTNSGNTTLTSAITVADNKIAPVSCPALPAGGLAPGANVVCSANYTTTQADVDGGGVTNTASASSGSAVSLPVSVTVPSNRTPSLTIVKSSTATGYAVAGTVIPYSFRVTNSGNTTITTAITVTDSKIASVSCPPLPAGGLAPAAFITCSASYTTTQADVDAGSIVNTASAVSGPLTSPTATHTITGTQAPALSIAKSTTTPSFNAVGVTIPYSYRVTNIGNVTLTSAITVSDSKIASVSCPALPAGGLAPGAFITCTANYTTVQADIDAGSVINTASARSGSVTSPLVSVTVPAAQAPGITVVKSTTTTSFSAAGVTIPYSYQVTNTGNTTLTSAVTVADNKIASVTCPALPAGGLAPGASITCSANYSTTQADVDAGGVTNTASATSGTSSSPPVSVTVPSTQTRALTVVKSTTTANFNAVGAAIPFSYRVTNSGNTTLTSPITVADNKIASVTCPALPAGGLVPGAVLICSGTYTTTQADIDAGGVTNIASATSGTTTSLPVSVTVPSTQTPALTVVKSTTTTSFNAVGVAITYSYRVTNSGNTTLTSAITVADNKIASVTCPALPAGGLMPGAVLICSGTYTTTQADIDAGLVTNTASATSGTTTSPTVNVTVPAGQTPGLAIAKTSTTTSFATAGVAIPYSYRVTNAGNTTLTSPITVADNKIASVTCPALPAAGLAPGASLTCTGTYTTTQADVDAGGVTNSASATSGTVVTSTVSLTVPSSRTPALTVVKATTVTQFNAVGVIIPFTYQVTNSGNTTVTAAITVSDNKIASVTCPALPAGGLLPGQSLTCTASYTTTQADVDAGGVTNTASATSGTTTSPPVSVTVPSTQSRALTVVKTSPTTSFNVAGIVIPYSYLVTNTGNTTFTAPITVADNKIPSVTCPALPAGGLQPTQSITCTGNYTTTQADVDAGGVTNTAGATSGTTTSPTVTLTIVSTRTPRLTIVKATTSTSFSAAGVAIPYTYAVTNSGNTTLTTAITVTDDKIASVTCPALPAGGLLPGQSITCNGTYTTTQADVDAGGITNTASATSGSTASTTVSVTVPAVQTRSIALVKATTATGYETVGAALPYTYTVRNTGNVTITTPITVADDKIASVTCPAIPAGGLAPNATIVCTGTHTVTQAEINSGSITNIASATSGTLVTPPATVTINAIQRPNFTTTKTTTSSQARSNGDGSFTSTFQIVIENTGNVDLTDLQANDDYQAQIPNGATVVSASILSATSSLSGALANTNTSFAAAAPNANLFLAPGIGLRVGERVTLTLDITFRPGPNGPSAQFTNIVRATTIFGVGTPLEVTATREGSAPVVFAADQPLNVVKTTPKTDVVIGELVPYTITVRNNLTFPRTNVRVVDLLPPGFKYRAGSATIDGIAREPLIEGNTLAWPSLTIPGSGSITIKLILVVGSGVGSGEFTNEALVRDALGAVISNVGKATVRLTPDPTFECTDIIGKVFDDKNRNGEQDEGERGLANVKVVTVRGQIITTDREGRYHIACADIPESDRGTNFILKLDERSLPTGYRVSTENPRVIRITKGKMAKINFGASIDRVARLDIADAAFEPGSTRLKAQWLKGIDDVIKSLATEKSVLRIAYRRSANEDQKLAAERIKSLVTVVNDQWTKAGGVYSLRIESEVVFERDSRR